MPFDPRKRPLTEIEARVLGTLVEKARTVPHSYPLTLNSLVIGCNQKTSREPLMELSETAAQEAIDSLAQIRGLSIFKDFFLPLRTFYLAQYASDLIA
jgi:uncharacterized protein